MIALLGMTATGKSSVGRLAAELRGLAFVDLDEAVETTMTITLANSIHQLGPSATLANTEASANDIVRHVLNAGAHLVAVGGLFPMSRAWREHIRDLATDRVWLTATPTTVWTRMNLSGTSHRASMLTSGANAVSQIDRLIRYREPYYRTLSGCIVSTDDITVDAVLDNVLKVVREQN